MSDTAVNQTKRTWLIATGCVGAAGGIATAVPFVSSLEPSERAKAAGAPVEVNISGIKPGEKIIVEWRGKPVWVMRRTPAELASLKTDDSELSDPNSDRTAYPNPPYVKNQWRSIKPEYLVVIGICTHLGCSPGDKFQPGPQPGLPNDWPGGFLCPCHGSTYDLAGRVFKNKPASDNLQVPPYKYLTDASILIGDDTKA
jgi:ubiquinol-cytochrome c reductase iron-sulfur subunit